MIKRVSVLVLLLAVILCSVALAEEKKLEQIDPSEMEMVLENNGDKFYIDPNSIYLDIEPNHRYIYYFQVMDRKEPAIIRGTVIRYIASHEVFKIDGPYLLFKQLDYSYYTTKGSLYYHDNRPSNWMNIPENSVKYAIISKLIVMVRKQQETGTEKIVDTSTVTPSRGEKQ